MEPDELEGTKGDSISWLKRKVRRLIKAVDILQSSDATHSADIAGNLASIGTNANDITNLQSSDATQSADIAGNLASIGTNTNDMTSLVSLHKHTYHISSYKTLPRIFSSF